MSDSSFDTSAYNIEATLTTWVAIAAATYVPALAPGAQVVRGDPEQPLATPVFAVDFPDRMTEQNFQGRGVGAGEYGSMQTGMMRVVMYASRASADWRAQLAQMADALRKAYYNQANAAVIVRDFGTDPVAPAATAYRVTLDSFETTTFPVSRNPDIEGTALFITYRYIERVTV